MLKNLKSLLDEAKENSYAIGSYSCYNYETIRGAIEAIKKLKVPGIIALGENYLNNINPEEFVDIVKSLEKIGEDVPIAIHLDHCKSIDHIVQAIQAGFTSVMYDGSDLDFVENIMKTKKVVDIAHAANVSVEAELGSLALGEFSNEEGAEQIYTDPEQAKQFIEETGVDALAVSIGTVHGMYKGVPKVNVNVLKKINEKVGDTPLVLHGGSGTPEDVIKECIKNGITKINVNTEISVNVVNQIRDKLAKEEKYHFSKVSLLAKEAVKEVVLKYSQLFYSVRS
ncbi:class II fructose-bisphosphate aldolase [Defluviitalea phaphyphila]|uniref:class II fructose-bisphosphate aldolase n=1 Tax=Defluviitalea phaphyphila TaxID=1473580 RepID=UPI000730120D|nr:class II fructose-bisphosphate aldolase [Defluviitalea phaphyphila]